MNIRNIVRISYLPHVLLALCIVWLAGAVRPPHTDSPFDLNSFSELPVLHGGRIKPMDTVARTSLLMLSGKQTLKTPEGRKPAVLWLLDMLFMAERADDYNVFEINDPDVLGLLKIQQTDQRLFAYRTLEPFLEEIEKQASYAEQTSDRTRFQSALLTLFSRINLYQKLQHTMQTAGKENALAEVQTFESGIRSFEEKKRSGITIDLKDENFISLAKILQEYKLVHEVAEFRPIPSPDRPEDPQAWMDIGEAITENAREGGISPSVMSYLEMGDAYRQADPARFNGVLAKYKDSLKQKIPGLMKNVHLEEIFNYSEPFYKSIILYVLVFLLAFVSWIAGTKDLPPALNRSAYWLLILAFVVQTLGLTARMVLQGRPPVTNLYSSAVFVGWGAVLLGIVVERLYRKGIGSVVAGAIGCATLIIAHHLSNQGDTMEMMRAVLDSNFWLATHVITITIGYSSTFLSGFIAVIYLFRRWLDRKLTPQDDDAFAGMVYGIVCFSLFFSFLGTILGGIWADQSWGRFWGWDPKENGALIIVLWNAFIVHARWMNFASTTRIMQMAVFGNIVTVLSWFGVNMLGVGLHSYGFMDQALTWIVIFSVSQLIIIGFGFLPERRTR